MLSRNEFLAVFLVCGVAAAVAILLPHSQQPEQASSVPPSTPNRNPPLVPVASQPCFLVDYASPGDEISNPCEVAQSIATDGRYIAFLESRGTKDTGTLLPDHLVVIDTQTSTKRVEAIDRNAQIMSQIAASGKDVISDGLMLLPNGTLHLDSGVLDAPAWPETFTPKAIHRGTLYGYAEPGLSSWSPRQGLRTLVASRPAPAGCEDTWGGIVGVSDQFLIYRTCATTSGDPHGTTQYHAVELATQRDEVVPTTWTQPFQTVRLGFALAGDTMIAEEPHNGHDVLSVWNLTTLARREIALDLPSNGFVGDVVVNGSHLLAAISFTDPGNYKTKQMAYAWGTIDGPIQIGPKRTMCWSSACLYTAAGWVNEQVLIGDQLGAFVVDPNHTDWPLTRMPAGPCDSNC